jgi:glycosyltransferase involved in cell wall biosynthesis
MAKRIREVVSRQDFDLVVASELGTACYSRYFEGIPALLDEVEVGLFFDFIANARTPWPRFRNRLTWIKHKYYLQQLLKDFYACTVPSERERDLLSKAVSGYKAIEVIPNCIDLSCYQGVPKTVQPNSLIFTGSFRYSANYDSMVRFLQEIYPLIQAKLPEVNLKITGDHVGLPLPHAGHVTLTGFVDDIKLLIASARVSIVPIRVGGGTRLKIIEAMALGTPVVTTSKGAEGLDVQSGKHLLIADTPETFAESVLCLLRDQELHDRLARNGYQLVREKYDLEVILPSFLSLVQKASSLKPLPNDRL